MTQNLLTRDINRDSNRLSHSKLTQFPTINRSKSAQFIPFIQERDSMGRLIGKHHRQLKNMPETSNNFFAGFETDAWNKLHETKIQRAMQNFFKKIDLEERQLKRNPFSPKKIAIVYSNKTSESHPTYSQVIEDEKLSLIKSKLCKIKQSIHQSHDLDSPIKKFAFDPKLVKNNSVPVKKVTEGAQSPTKSPTKHRKNKSNMSLKQRNQQTELKKKESSGKLSLKIKQGMEHPELRRYRQLSKLAIKVVPNYEQGHNRFFQKMKQSKRIAHNIKKQLQLQ